MSANNPALAKSTLQPGALVETQTLRDKILALINDPIRRDYVLLQFLESSDDERLQQEAVQLLRRLAQIRSIFRFPARPERGQTASLADFKVTINDVRTDKDKVFVQLQLDCKTLPEPSTILLLLDDDEVVPFDKQASSEWLTPVIALDALPLREGRHRIVDIAILDRSKMAS